MRLIHSFLFLCWLLPANAQTTLRGSVFNTASEPLTGATVQVPGLKGTLTDARGAFVLELKSPPPADARLEISYLGYVRQVLPLNGITGPLNIVLEADDVSLPEVLVACCGSSEGTPVTRTRLNRETIQDNNLGQDVPYLLQRTPSALVHSDAGAGIGYTYLRIRGSDQTRINVTINGVPLNDAESQQVFWVDLPDFLNSAQSIEVQRGVGSSTNGAGAFGGTVAIQTDHSRQQAHARLEGGVGSFGTRRAAVSFGTGTLPAGWYFNGRASRIHSDGYLNRASSDLTSYALHAGVNRGKHQLQFHLMHGHELTYQAWNGVPAQYIQDPVLRRFNVSGTERPGSPHPNEVDDYTQTHYQLHWNWSPHSQIHVNAALHYTRGYGFFEQYRAGQYLPDYQLDTLPGITRTDLIRRRWLDNHFYGAVYQIQWRPRQGIFTLGGAWNEYLGRHFGQVHWAHFMPGGFQNHLYYDNNGDKQDANVYLKYESPVRNGWNAYLDAQYRSVQYLFEGPLQDGRLADQQSSFHFFNPKAGLQYRPNERQRWYGSFAVGQREPTRDEFVQSTPASRPKAEQLFNTELGTEQRYARGAWSVNLYHMHYRNQLLPTGQLNDVGAAVRVNVPSSYRLGVEMTGEWQPLPAWNLYGNLTWSRNRIKTYTEFIDNWETGIQDTRVLENTPIALTPDWMGQGGVSWTPLRGKNQLSMALETRYVGRQYLDNSGTLAASLDPYFLLDGRVHWSLVPRSWFRKSSLILQVNNLLNTYYSAFAWVYRYRVESFDPVAGDPFTVRENANTFHMAGHSPQATTHFLLAFKVEW